MCTQEVIINHPEHTQEEPTWLEFGHYMYTMIILKKFTLCPNQEGTYKIKKVLGKEAYKLEYLHMTTVPKTWNS